MAKIGSSTEEGARDRKMREGRLPVAGEFVVGAWLVVAAFLFDYSVTLAGSAGFWNVLLCGAVVAVVAAVRLVAPRAAGWLGLVNVLVGFWLIVSPFALGYPVEEGHRDAAKTNALVAGILVAVFSVTAVTVAARRRAAARHRA